MPEPSWYVPPRDHGSDRHGHVEYAGAPTGIQPTEAVVEAMFVDACQDCRPDLSLRWVPSDHPDHAWLDANGQHWLVTVAHDQTCPRSAAS